jgi:hypothetical protein
MLRDERNSRAEIHDLSQFNYAYPTFPAFCAVIAQMREFCSVAASRALDPLTSGHEISLGQQRRWICIRQYTVAAIHSETARGARFFLAVFPTGGNFKANARSLSLNCILYGGGFYVRSSVLLMVGG